MDWFYLLLFVRLGAEDVRLGKPVYGLFAGNPPSGTQDAEGNMLLGGRHRPQLYPGTLPCECKSIIMMSYDAMLNY